MNPIDEITPNLFFEGDSINTNQNTQIVSNINFPNIMNYDNFDAGDRGEVYIFGKKLTNLYLNGALFISNINNWNTNLTEFRKSFISQNNNQIPSKINESNLSKLFFNTEELINHKQWFKGHIKTRKSEDNENENEDDDSFINISYEFNKIHK